MEAQLDLNETEDVQGLVVALASKDPVQRERARQALVAAGHSAVIPLITLLKSPRNRVCWEAAKALGAIKDPAAATALAENLDVEDSDVRWVTAEALIALGKEGLKQTLVVLLTKAASTPVRLGALHVIWHFAHRYSGERLMPLLARFRAYEPAVAIPPAALHALHEMERGDLRP